MAEKKQIFNLGGGLNQDDSLLTPAKGTAGRSLFGLGDYRYALNGRIGSSRSDNFGDFENLRSSVEVTNYYRTQQVFTNPIFDGTLAPWLQLDDGPGYTAWTWTELVSNGYAIFTSPSGAPFTSQVLYQTGLTLGSTVSFQISPPFLVPPLLAIDGNISIVFLNGTTVLSEVPYPVADFYTGLNVTLAVPATCNGIGIRIAGTTEPSFFSAAWQVDFLYGFSQSLGAVPAGTEKVVGRLEDKEFLKYYYSVWNSNGDHTIRMYDYTTNVVYELLKWSGLNFTSASFVKMAKLDNWMALAHRENAPRLIDVDTITDLYNQLGTDFREFHIALHKWAPTSPPVPRIYYDGSTNNFEKLKNKNYQFSYRYVYKGNLKSRFSPISKAAPTGNLGQFYAANTITSIEVSVIGSILDQPGVATEYNYFGHDDIKFTAAIEYIELAYREGELDIWKLWKRVYAPFSSTYHFDGSFDGRPLNADDFNQPFDTVPFLAGTVEAIDNRFVLGDCLEEYEPAVISIEDTGMVTDPLADWRDSSTGSFSQFSGDPTLRAKLQRFNALSNFNLKARGLYKIGFQFGDHKGWRSAVYTDETMTFEFADASQYRLNAMTFKIPDSIVPPEWATCVQVMRTNVLNFDYFMIGMANQFKPLLDSANALVGMTGLPQQVKDKLNQHFENSKIVDGYEVAATIEQVKGLNALEQAVFAKTGELKSREKSLQKYLRFNSIFNILGPEVRSSNGTGIAITNASRIFIDINNWYNAAKETASKDRKLSKLYYNFRQGDRVRFWASTVANPTAPQITLYDVEIIEFTGTGLIVEKPEGVLSIPTEVAPWSASKFGIEIYTPKKPNTAEEFVFYETGEWYPILYPGTSSRDFSKRDWVYTTNAAVTVDTYGPFDVFSKMPFYFGDCFNISKTVYRDLSILSAGVGTSMNPDPDRTFDLWDKSNGRPAVAYLDLPVAQFKRTLVRFGGKIVEESNINALNRFREFDQKIYPSEYGRIRDLVNTSNAQVESVGSILLALGEREAWSIYINRTTLEDLSGRTQVALSDQVLGSYNTLLGSHGTLNPESVSQERGNVYWWDAISGSWIRYGRDGLTEISQYKMRNWFRELSALLYDKYATDEVPRVISDYDGFNEELVTFINHSALPETFRGYTTYKGAMFSEEDTRWKSIHSYEPEFFGKIGTLLLAFVGGKLYKLEQGTTYNTFFGVKKDSMIEPVFNEDEMNVKSWQDIAITATHGWSVERILSEYRGAKTKQQSRILLTSFTEKEDTYYAAFKNNLNSPNVGNPIIEGEKMRSKAIQVLMKLDPAVEILSLLQYVTVGMIDSPKNPVKL